MLGTLAHAAFTAALGANMVWLTAVLRLLSFLPLHKERKEGWGLMLAQLAWRMSLLAAPWIRCTSGAGIGKTWTDIQATVASANAEAAKRGEPQKPLMLLSNHTSVFDAMLYTCVVPSSILWKNRAYIDARIVQTPLIGTVCRLVGHFQVPFMSTAEGAFDVDKARAAQVDAQVNKHLDEGGWLCFYPEGQLNKTPTKLLPFRHGGMKKALEYDAIVGFFVTCGNEFTWPKSCLTGGYPGRVSYSAKIIAPDGVRALVKKLRAKPDLPEQDRALEDPALLGKYTQAMMQEQYDELLSVSGR